MKPKRSSKAGGERGITVTPAMHERIHNNLTKAVAIIRLVRDSPGHVDRTSIANALWAADDLIVAAHDVVGPY